MPDLKEVVLATVNGQALTLYDLLYRQKLRGDVDFIEDAVRDAIIAQAIRSEGLTVDDTELQRAADALRVQSGLYRSHDTHQWLKQHHLGLEDLERSLEHALCLGKLKEKCTGHLVEGYFQENRSRYQKATLSHIVVAEEGLAAGIKEQIDEEDADFSRLAHAYSIDEKTKHAGGWIGSVRRSALTAEVQAAVFAATAGAVVGPVHTPAGWHLLWVWELRDGELDATVRAEIIDELFEIWIGRQVKAARIEIFAKV